jgi:c-di-GMP-binding flagellar brake protein YcgR
MFLPSVGQVVKLKPIVTDEAKANKMYKSRLADIQLPNLLYFELPLDEETGKPGFFPEGTEFFFSYVHPDGNHYHFRSRIVGRKYENVPLILVAVPDQETIEKTQRRSFLRVDAHLDLAVKTNSPSREYHFVTRTVDISGGGLSFTCNPNYILKVGDPMKLWCVLPEKHGGMNHLAFDGEVVRVNSHEEPEMPQWVSVKFVSIRDVDRQKIIRYCFERQIELYKKGIGQ